MLKEALEQHGVEVNHEADASGTSYFGEVEVTYEQLVEIFGPPRRVKGDGTTVEWTLEVTEEGGVHGPDTAVVTIYDYMTGLLPEQNTRWNLGAHSGWPTDPVRDVIEMATKEAE